MNTFFFDLDGTLVDTEVLWLEAIRLAMAGRGAPIDPPTSERLVYGKSWADIFNEIDQTFPGLWNGITDMEPVTEMHFKTLRASREIELPSSVDLLRRLGADHTLAIVSGSTNGNIAHHIDELGIAEFVDFYLGCESYSPGKPDPACYLMAAEKAGVAPDDCCVFEDSLAGVTAAKAAGMYCVALKRPEAPDQDVSAADVVLTDLADFQMP